MKKLIALVVLVLVVGGLVYLHERSRLATFVATPHAVPAEVVVTIPPRTGPKTVAQKLEAAGAITDARLFYWDVRYRRRIGGRLRAGQYEFRPDAPQTPEQIIQRLLKGEVLEVKVTVPEGLRLDEQAAVFREHGLAAATDFVERARDPAFVQSLGLDAPSLEGFLFPDTYLVPKNIKTDALLKLMVEHFQKAWKTADSQRLPNVGLGELQAVTLASIVEKETGQPQERPHISCVFHNRLERGMKLQTDPTVIYSILMSTGHFDGNIHKRDLTIDNPYNTYVHTGLPPGPIASPGLAALEAALRPISCDDLFFVSKNDGTHVFCPNLACHERNVEIWQREYFRKKREQSAQR